MKKTSLAVIVLVVLVFAIVGWFFVSKKGSPTVQQSPGNQVAEQMSPKPQDKMINSIKDAIGLGTQMKCTYSTTAGGSTFESTVFVEGKKYKSIATVAGKVMNSVSDGETIYSWAEGQKTGTKMTLSCINDLKDALPKAQQNNPPAGVQTPDDQFNAATNTSCSAATGTDFSAPADVTFTDQCEVLKNSLNTLKDAQGQMPANVPKLPSGVSVPGY